MPSMKISKPYLFKADGPVEMEPIEIMDIECGNCGARWKYPIPKEHHDYRLDAERYKEVIRAMGQDMVTLVDFCQEHFGHDPITDRRIETMAKLKELMIKFNLKRKDRF